MSVGLPKLTLLAMRLDISECQIVTTSIVIVKFVPLINLMLVVQLKKLVHYENVSITENSGHRFVLEIPSDREGATASN